MEDEKSNISLEKTLKVIFGLSPETINDIRKLIKSKGENGTMKIHMTSLNQMARQRMKLALAAGVKENDVEQGEEGVEKKEPPKEVKEAAVGSQQFKSFLMELMDEKKVGGEEGINVNLSPDEVSRLRNPEKRQMAKRKERQNKNPAMAKRIKQQQIKKLQQELRDNK